MVALHLKTVDDGRQDGLSICLLLVVSMHPAARSVFKIACGAALPHVVNLPLLRFIITFCKLFSSKFMRGLFLVVSRVSSVLTETSERIKML